MLIATDIDGVLADFAAGWVERYNVEFAADVDVATVTRWDSIVTSTTFGTPTSFFEWLAGIPGFWRSLQPLQGSVDAVRRLRHSHDVVAVTQRPADALEETRSWLDEHFGDLPLRLTDDKRVAGVDILVDDSPEVLASLAGWDAALIRFAQPWNEGSPGIRAAGWGEVLRVVDRLGPHRGGRRVRRHSKPRASTATLAPLIPGRATPPGVGGVPRPPQA